MTRGKKTVQKEFRAKLNIKHVAEVIIGKEVISAGKPAEFINGCRVNG